MAIILVLALVGAGCVDDASDATPSPLRSGCDGEACKQPTERGSSLPPVLPTPTFSDCYEIGHTMEVRNELWNPDYPPGVEPGTTFGSPAHVVELVYWSCRQAVIGEVVEQDLQMFFFSGAIKPPDQSAANDTHSRYLFDAYTNSHALAAYLRVTTDANLRVSNLSSPERSTLADSPERMEEYRLVIGDSSEADYEVHGLLRGTQTGPTSETEGYYFLDAGGALTNFRLSWDGIFGPSAAVQVSFGDGSYFGQHSEISDYAGVNAPSTNISAKLHVPPGSELP